jgi:hypothetical protein
MARSEAQSDFAVIWPEVPLSRLPALPMTGEPVVLPPAEVRTAEAGALATRWVMRLTILVLFALLVLCAVGPHIPAGE